MVLVVLCAMMAGAVAVVMLILPESQSQLQEGVTNNKMVDSDYYNLDVRESVDDGKYECGMEAAAAAAAAATGCGHSGYDKLPKMLPSLSPSVERRSLLI